jgi:hypothetical protein
VDEFLTISCKLYLSLETAMRNIILGSMRKIQGHFMSFKECTTEINPVDIANGECYSYVGRVGTGAQI